MIDEERRRSTTRLTTGKEMRNVQGIESHEVEHSEVTLGTFSFTVSK